MAKVLMDELHIRFTVAKTLSRPERNAIFRIVQRPIFRRQLRDAVAKLMRRYPAFRPAAVHVTW